MGVSGACRCCELTNLKISDVEDRGAYLIVSIPDTKTGVSRKFTILEEGFSINTVEKCRKYMFLRPKKLSIERFFLRYAKQKCTSQPVGINTLSKVPSIVASFLNLANAEAYTGHCMRRTATTLLANGGANLTTIKRHGGWRSSAIAETYIEDSVSNKLDISRKIQGSPGTSRSLLETSIVPTTTIRSGTDNNYKLLINGNEVKYDKTKNEMSINVNVNVNINNK
jgi:integrase